MAKKKKKQVRNVIPMIYIIEVITPNDGTYYKVGFTDVEDNSRPLRLVKEYKELHPENKVRLVKTFILPLRKGCYFDDDMVRRELCTLNFMKIIVVDPKFIAKIIGVDGKNEFVEVLDTSISITKAVEKAIESLAQTKTNFKYNIRNILAYDATQTHKITGSLITDIENYIGYKIADKHYGNCLLFIGQPEPQWLATLALTNIVVCLTDDADERPVFDYPALNDAIIYANKIEEIIDMKLHFNLIISNPPYGSIGTTITNEVKGLDYDEFINLLPANDYKDTQKTNYKLYNYQSDMVCITKTNVDRKDKKFADASVTTHLARIHKEKVNNLSEEEFEISNYIDEDLNKYFLNNIKRKANRAIKESETWIYFNGKEENTRTVLLDHRFIGNKHLAYSKDTAEYKWNVEKSIDLQWLATNSNCPSTVGKLNKYIITFDTPKEKDNFVEFIYSDLGFKFIAKIATACNGDSTKPLYYLLPNVDWTKHWTVESLLKEEYNYSDAEVKKVIDSLAKFRGLSN